MLKRPPVIHIILTCLIPAGTPLELVRGLLPLVSILLGSRYESYALAALHALDLFTKCVLPWAAEHFASAAPDNAYSGQSPSSQHAHAYDSSDDDDDSGGPGRQRGDDLEEVTRKAIQLNRVLLALAQMKDSRVLKRLCGQPGSRLGGRHAAEVSDADGPSTTAELNVSHRARRIVDVIGQLQREFLSHASNNKSRVR